MLRVVANVLGAIVLVQMAFLWLPTVWHRTDLYRDAYTYYLGGAPFSRAGLHTVLTPNMVLTSTPAQSICGLPIAS